ncbi:MAG: hypothetical protein A2X64_06700 [Ignavibacteria bacterium GWF2_33_9]|nr:MAG: hypothetical protein A2X64_06700 [Ignavibacteria bacterium GWF2_33_9]
MDKVQVIILGITSTPGGSAYGLILKEIDSNRRIPILIGSPEAQSIAFEIEGVVPPRPMTHDLIRNIIDNFDLPLSEVFIDELNEGTFHAKMIFESEDIQIDCRPSDAIAVALRLHVPITINKDIMDEATNNPQFDEFNQNEELQNPGFKEHVQKSPTKRIDILQSQLDKAIKDENYEVAAKIRDEIKKLLESS